MSLSTTPKTTDTKLTRWKRILQKYQNKAGSLAHNNAKLTDTVRRTQFKVLRAIKGT